MITEAQRICIDGKSEDQLRTMISVLTGSRTENREALIEYCREKMAKDGKRDVFVEQTDFSDFGEYQ